MKTLKTLILMIFLSKVIIAQQIVPYVNLSDKSTEWKSDMIYFVDDFNDNNNNWSYKDKTAYSISDGYLKVYGNWWNASEKLPLSCSNFYPLDFTQDLIFEVKLKVIDDFSKLNREKEYRESDIQGSIFGNIFFISSIDCFNNSKGIIQIVDKNLNIVVDSINKSEFFTVQIISKSKNISIYINGNHLRTYKIEGSPIKTIYQPQANRAKPLTSYPKEIYVAKDRTTITDYIYIYKNYSSKEEMDYLNVLVSKNYDLYLNTYPNGVYSNEILQFKEDKLFNTAKNGFINDCDNYLVAFPAGKYVTEINQLKSERVLYNKALNGGLTEFNNYLLKYPNGFYSSEVTALKNKKLQEIERNKKITANSNKALWKIGNKMCMETSMGTVCGTLNAWNEDKSMFQLKVISGPDTRIEGQQIKEGEIIWVTADKTWHICLQEEIEASVAQNVDPYKYWKLGKKICLSGTKGAWIFKSSITIVGEIIQWNEDKSKVRIRIIDGADGTYYNNETLYNDKMIWDSPSGWKLCN